MDRLINVDQFKVMIDMLKGVSDGVDAITEAVDMIDQNMDNLITVIADEFGDDYVYQEVLCDYCWYYDFGRNLDRSNPVYDALNLAPVIDREDAEHMRSTEELYDYLVGISCEPDGDEQYETV